MISRIQNSRRAVTLTELLVVLAIISLLATIAVPVFIQKTEQARLAVARQEVREIAAAEDHVALLYGFYVPIHILNNVPNLPAGQAATTPRDDFENDPNLSSKAVMDPFADLQNQVSNPLLMNVTNIEQNVRIRKLVNAWAGPFLNPQRLAMGDADMGSLSNSAGGATQTEVSRALVIDPWGRPYRIYSPEGVVGSAVVTDPPTLSTATGLFDLTLDDGQLTNTDQRFDRWAIVSFGRDGVTDTGITGELRDDIFYVFGIVPGESFYRAF
jgi:prepilin-type N-terminal cleavage/methylation domain-containing protein